MKKETIKINKDVINFCKIILPNELSVLEGDIWLGHDVDAYATIQRLKKSYSETFPFKYGSEMTQDYKDESVFIETK